MPKVPYSPVATAQPTAPGEGVSISTPGAAFGENIGAAIEKLGSTVGQVGNELWQRAIALQDLANENAAREAQTKFALGASQLHADYSAKTGKDASDSLQGFLDSQAQLRTQIGSSLGSPMAKKYYDADSLPFMQRNVFSAAAHAAEENKKYTIDTIKAGADQDLKSIGDDPNHFIEKRDSYVDKASQVAMVVHGTYDMNDPVVKDAITNATSSATKEHLLGISKTNASGAMGMLPQYRKDLTDPDYITLQNQLEGRATAVVASNLADNAAQEAVGGGVPVEQAIKKQKEIAARDYPGNERLPMEVERSARSQIGSMRWQQGMDEKIAQQDAAETIAKMGIHDLQAWQSLPNHQDIEARLGIKNSTDMSGYIHRVNNQLYATTNQEAKQRAEGMAHDPARREDFLSQDFSTWQLNSADAEKYRQLQIKYTSDPKSGSDPRVSRYMGYALNTRGEELHALGVDRYTANNADDYYKFRGVVSEALDVWTQDHKRAPTPQEFSDNILPSLIRTQATQTGWMGSVFGSQEPAFHQWGPRPAESEVPIEFRERAIEEAGKARIATPTEAQIYRAYLRDQFQKLYPGSKSGTTPDKSGDRFPAGH